MYLCVACDVLKVCFSVLPLPFSIVSVYIVFPSLSFFVPLLYHSCASLSIDRLHNLCVLCVPLFVHCATVCLYLSLSVCASACVSLSVTLSAYLRGCAAPLARGLTYPLPMGLSVCSFVPVESFSETALARDLSSK